MTGSIADMLSRIGAPGTFATRLAVPARDLVMTVEGVGPVPMPVTPEAARALASVALPSPFGLRDRTLYDPEVRSSSEIAARKIRIDARWQPMLRKYLEQVRGELGLPEQGRLRAVLDKLVIYQEGQHFEPHQDSERSDAMVGTLVVVLPSEHRGGALVVEHDGRKKTFARTAHESNGLSLVAFYADCRHEITRVSKGVRIALTYRLELTASRAPAQPSTAPAAVVEALAARLREHFTVPVVRRFSQKPAAPHERWVYLLDHEYTERSLSAARLKNADRERVAALREAASKIDCSCCLALAEVHEIWSCEDEYDHYRRRDRWGWRGRHHDDDGETGDAEEAYRLTELSDVETDLQHWVDLDGRPVEPVGGAVSESEVCATTASSKLRPFRSEHEGYQGNYGNTVDRWYRRAALVVWPNERTFVLRAERSPVRAMDELLALPRSGGELDARVRQLAPRWASIVSQAKSAGLFAKATKLATRLDDGELVQHWLSPFGPDLLSSRAVRRDLATLVDRHGAPWGAALFAAWSAATRWDAPRWLQLLAAICADLRASPRGAGAELAAHLLTVEARAALRRARQAAERPQSWLRLDGFAREGTDLADVLAAADEAPALGLVDEVAAELSGGAPRFPVALLVETLRRCRARSPQLASRMRSTELQRACIERLEIALRAPARAHDDWSIDHAVGCGCADCRALARFVGSGEVGLDWPLAEQRRRHIHGVIDQSGLPITHATLRKGSPYRLQLRKTADLHRRETEHRAALAAALRELA